MKEKTFLFLAAFMLIFLAGCSSPFGSNKIPEDAPAMIEVPSDSVEDLNIEDNDLVEMEEDVDDGEIANDLDQFDEVIDIEEEVEVLEEEVDVLLDDYEEIFQ